MSPAADGRPGAPVQEEGPSGIVIVGAGGFGREVLQYLEDIAAAGGTHRVRGFLDDFATKVEPPSLGMTVLGTVRDYEPRPDEAVVLAIGKPELRVSIGASLRRRGARFATVIHPLAYVAASARIGAGCIVAPFATVGAHAELAENVVLTFYASVAHDARVGEGSALSPYSVANGGAVLGRASFLGAGSVVNPMKRVGEYARVAAGSVVYRDVPDRSLASGNPAKARPLLGV